MENERVPYVPVAAFGKGAPRGNTRESIVVAEDNVPQPVSATGDEADGAVPPVTATGNEIDGAIPPVTATGNVTDSTVPSPVANEFVPSVVVAEGSAHDSTTATIVPAVRVSNPHQQLLDNTARTIRHRPAKWTKRCHFDATTGCNRGADCFFGHSGDVYTDSPTVLQEFATNGFNINTLRRAELERRGGPVDVGPALNAVVARTSNKPNKRRNNAGKKSDKNKNAKGNSSPSSRNLFLAGAKDANAHYTPLEHLWDEETLNAGPISAPPTPLTTTAPPAPLVEYEGMQMQPYLAPAPSPPVAYPLTLPAAYTQHPNGQERNEYPSVPAPTYAQRDYNDVAPFRFGLVYGLTHGMVPHFGAVGTPLESPGNLFRLNTTSELYYYGVDGVTYQYNPAFWASQDRQYYIERSHHHYMLPNGNVQQYSGPSADPAVHRPVHSWLDTIPSDSPHVPEGYGYVNGYAHGNGNGNGNGNVNGYAPTNGNANAHAHNSGSWPPGLSAPPPLQQQYPHHHGHTYIYERNAGNDGFSLRELSPALPSPSPAVGQGARRQPPLLEPHAYSSPGYNGNGNGNGNGQSSGTPPPNTSTTTATTAQALTPEEAQQQLYEESFPKLEGNEGNTNGGTNGYGKGGPGGRRPAAK